MNKNSIAKKWYAYIGWKTSIRKIASEEGVSRETVRKVVKVVRPNAHCVCCGTKAKSVRNLKEHYAKRHPGFCFDWLSKDI